LKKIIVIFLVSFLISCKDQSQINSSEISSVYTEKQEAIIEEYIYNCADTYNYNSPEYQECLNAGIEKDSTVAYLWQQKAMPYFKARKYEVGMKYIDKAVKYNPERYLPYRAFIKCIFAKTYVAAIKDFEECIDRYGNSYVMDHTFNFHIALSYLQLNEFKKAEQIFAKDISEQVEEWGEDGVHHLDLFYYGITKYEQKKYKEAILEFDKALKIYPQFSDVKYYKAICLARIGESEQATKTFEEAKTNGKAGFTINEDNAIYETYPYQKRWQ